MTYKYSMKPIGYQNISLGLLKKDGCIIFHVDLYRHFRFVNFLSLIYLFHSLLTVQNLLLAHFYFTKQNLL